MAVGLVVAALEVAKTAMKVKKVTDGVKNITKEKDGNYLTDKVKVKGAALNKVGVGIKNTDIAKNIKSDVMKRIDDYLPGNDIEVKDVDTFSNENDQIDITNNKFDSINENETQNSSVLDRIYGYFNPDDSSVKENEIPISDTKEDSDVKNKSVDNKDVEKMSTRNERLGGERHPKTGVPFDTKIVGNSEGKLVEVTVPEFTSDFDAQLPKDLYKGTDRVQFKECNEQLKSSVENDVNLESKFSDEQLEQISDGETPDGYTWHHDAENGKLQLVDSEKHAQTAHTGGKIIWGGGNTNR